MSLAYIELQKAHVKDLIASGNNTDLRTNAIVLFTDGGANQFAVYLNQPGASVVKPTATSECTYQTATSSASTQMIGSIGNNGNSLYQLTSLDTFTSTGSYWGTYFLENAFASDALEIHSTTPLSGPCKSAPDMLSSSTITGIPAQDFYGNSTNGGGYWTSSFVDDSTPPVQQYTIYAPSTSYSPTSVGTVTNVSGSTNVVTGKGHSVSTQLYELQIAAWNALDNAGGEHTTRLELHRNLLPGR